MTDQRHLTRLESLRLLNYRRFEDIHLELHPELTVLVAANGGGKTALLDGAAVALHSFVDTLRSANQSHGFVRTDIRLARRDGIMVPVTPTALEAAGIVDGRPTKWYRELASLGGRTTHAQAGELGDRAKSLLKDLRDFADHRRPTPPVLPAIAYYGTGRLWSEHKLTEKKKKAAEDLLLQTGAYVDCLSPSSSYGHFVIWFERVVREAQNERETGVASPHRPQALLAAVRSAVDVVLRPSGWQQLDWDFLSSEIVANHAEHGRLPVSLLSDGIRNLVAMVADLAHRAARLNPHLGPDACARSPGIVLIDEVDMHLHPAWQQTVVASLREAFPLMQFIVTTHSHLVVSTVPSDCVRILQSDGSVSRPSVETQGYDSPFTLGVVFGVDSKPPGEIAGKLSRYRELLEQGQGDAEEARTLREQLEQHFGAQHPAMLAAESIRRLQDFKARMAARRGGG
jgi:predicted ATP-binding protein involved in virulence